MKHQILALLLATTNLHANDAQLINNLIRYVPTTDLIKKALFDLQGPERELPTFTLDATTQDWSLYRAFPGLIETLPRVRLCNLPTPVQFLEQCSEELGVELYIKRDDLTAHKGHFGGNKPRKLETILAEAQRHGVKTVITFGCIGSNHATATADYAKMLGLDCILMLKPQPVSRVVRRNLMLMDYFDADIHFCPSHALRDADVVNTFLRHKLDYGTFPYVIPTGAETALGAVGYVNAAFELQEQITKGLLPEPDYIYVATGGFGHPQGLLGATIAGLIVGLKAAGLKSKAVGVFTEPEKAEVIDKLLLQQCAETIELLRQADPNFPNITITRNDYDMICDCAGEDYGVFSSEGVEAINLLKQCANIQLDGTYTGKAFAGLVRDARSGKLQNKIVLFWNTFCADEFKGVLKRRSYTSLPHALHKYFEGETQELDKE